MEIKCFIMQLPCSIQNHSVRVPFKNTIAVQTRFVQIGRLLSSRDIMHMSVSSLPIRNAYLLFYGSVIFQLLETIIKNCGDIVHMHVAERDVLHEMVKIVKKKVFIFLECFNSLPLLYLLSSCKICLIFVMPIVA